MWALIGAVSLTGVIIALSYYTVNLDVKNWIIKTLLLFATMAFLIISANYSLSLVRTHTEGTGLLPLVVVSQNVLIWFLYILTAYFVITLMLTIFGMFDDAQKNISKTP